MSYLDKEKMKELAETIREAFELENKGQLELFDIHTLYRPSLTWEEYSLYFSGQVRFNGKIKRFWMQISEKITDVQIAMAAKDGMQNLRIAFDLPII